eukprot:COSAG06_NODE_721_length_12803_cov_167.866105_5_plen_88_part_00
MLCLQIHADEWDEYASYASSDDPSNIYPDNIIVGGNTDSPLWANAAFVASAIAILGPEEIVPHMAPGLVAHADVLVAIRRGRASSRA